jgi:flagellar basal-body rod modification protein FlgD
MAIDSTNALDSAYASALDATLQTSGGDELDKQAFLMLLVTQFQYQDPLNPMEDKEFVAQLAQFSALEQSMAMNENLTSLLTLQQQQTAIGAANYIGREVSARGYGISLENGVSSVVQYATAEEMASGYVNILDSATSTILATVDLGNKSASIHDFQWDGKQSNGADAPDGLYVVSFVAYNSSGERILVDTSVTGKVTGVSTYNGEQYLSLSDGRTVLLSNVREIVESGTSADAASGGEEDDADASGSGAPDLDESFWDNAKAKLLEWLGA